MLYYIFYIISVYNDMFDIGYFPFTVNIFDSNGAPFLLSRKGDEESNSEYVFC